MVFYECVITAKNTSLFDQLTNIVKKFSHEIVKEGGVVRSVQNHGIRDLPTRFKARYPDGQGNRYYRKGRFLSIYFDSNPFAMKMAENALNLDAEVLRYTNLKSRSPLDFVNTTREDRNPYIRRIVKMERDEARRIEKMGRDEAQNNDKSTPDETSA